VQAAVPLWKVSLAPPRRRTEPGPQGPGFLLSADPRAGLICRAARNGRFSIANNIGRSGS
jgi:hypothetical protein